MIGNADKEDPCLYLISEHEERDQDVKGSGSSNLGQAFHGSNEVQVRYIQHRGLE